jgi:hypothetical protein
MKKPVGFLLIDITELLLIVAVAWLMFVVVIWLANERSQNAAVLALEATLLLLLVLICVPQKTFPEKWRNNQRLRTAIAPLGTIALYSAQLISFGIDGRDMAFSVYCCAAVFWAIYVKWGWGNSIRERTFRLLATPVIAVVILHGVIWLLK